MDKNKISYDTFTQYLIDQFELSRYFTESIGTIDRELGLQRFLFQIFVIRRFIADWPNESNGSTQTS